jgi:hypothetical protein
VKPTPEQITEARKIAAEHRAFKYLGMDIDDALSTLLAATEPHEHEATIKKLEIEFTEGRCVEI